MAAPELQQNAKQTPKAVQELQMPEAKLQLASDYFQPSRQEGFQYRTTDKFLEQMSDRLRARARSWVNTGDPNLYVAIDKDGKISDVKIFADGWGYPDGSPMKKTATSYLGKKASGETLSQLANGMLDALRTALLDAKEQKEEPALRRVSGTEFECISPIPGFDYCTDTRFLEKFSPAVRERARVWVNYGDPHVHVALSEDGKIANVLMGADNWGGSLMEKVGRSYVDKEATKATLNKLLFDMRAAMNKSFGGQPPEKETSKDSKEPETSALQPTAEQEDYFRSLARRPTVSPEQRINPAQQLKPLSFTQEEIKEFSDFVLKHQELINGAVPSGKQRTD